jgi:hypothetical protein
MRLLIGAGEHSGSLLRLADRAFRVDRDAGVRIDDSKLSRAARAELDRRLRCRELVELDYETAVPLADLEAKGEPLGIEAAGRELSANDSPRLSPPRLRLASLSAGR